MATTVGAADATPYAEPAGATRARDRRTLVVFALAVFANAALLFAVQPMFSKLVLPMLGGSPAVWNTCMLFFQTVLLAGYFYAHVISTRLDLRRQRIVHLSLLGVSLLALPIALPEGWRPPAHALPVGWLVLLLLVSIGAPFLALSTGAPLLQRWFSRTGHPAAANPYFLYAASNLGSFAALLAYPFVIEPMFGVTAQRWAWSALYVALLPLLAWCALRARPEQAVVDAAPAVPADDAPATDTPAAPVARTQRLRWVLLAFAPSSLLLGVTTFITTDIASFPLLWVIPLALYLLTFVIAFSRRPVIPHWLAVWIQAPLILILVVLVALTMHRRVIGQSMVHLAAFFVTALVCHGELARRKPSAERLTEFYLWISVGGMLGGLFNALLAPVLYDSVVEYRIALIAACLLRPLMGANESVVDGPQRPPTRAERWWRQELVDDGGARNLDILMPAALFLTLAVFFRSPWSPEDMGRWAPGAAYTVAALIILQFRNRPIRFGLGVAALLAGAQLADRQENVLLRERSFFGVYRVLRYGEYFVFQHGTTTHGGQSRDPRRRAEPLTYYHRESPVAQVFATLMPGNPNRRVAVVGLGTGTLACFGRTHEWFTFYEIDPVVLGIARDPRWFTYMRDCPPAKETILGDARLSLARAPDGEYDLILLDAFSSDAIPTHLMTREALALYLEKLAPGGSIAFHISNRYMELEPVLAELARDARLAGTVGQDTALSAAARAQYAYLSKWVVLSRDANDHAPLTRLPGWTALPPASPVRLWTDDYSDLLAVLKWGR